MNADFLTITRTIPHVASRDITTHHHGEEPGDLPSIAFPGSFVRADSRIHVLIQDSKLAYRLAANAEADFLRHIETWAESTGHERQQRGAVGLILAADHRRMRAIAHAASARHMGALMMQNAERDLRKRGAYHLISKQTNEGARA